MKPRTPSGKHPNGSKSTPNSRRGSADFPSLPQPPSTALLAPINELAGNPYNSPPYMGHDSHRDSISSGQILSSNQQISNSVSNNMNQVKTSSREHSNNNSNKNSRNGSSNNINKPCYPPWTLPWHSNYPMGMTPTQSEMGNDYLKYQMFNLGRRKSTGEVSFRSDVCTYNGSNSCTPVGFDKPLGGFGPALGPPTPTMNPMNQHPYINQGPGAQITPPGQAMSQGQSQNQSQSQNPSQSNQQPQQPIQNTNHQNQHNAQNSSHQATALNNSGQTTQDMGHIFNSPTDSNSTHGSVEQISPGRISPSNLHNYWQNNYQSGNSQMGNYYNEGTGVDFLG